VPGVLRAGYTRTYRRVDVLEINDFFGERWIIRALVLTNADARLPQGESLHEELLAAPLLEPLQMSYIHGIPTERRTIAARFLRSQVLERN
jgi:hypothetical protein